MWQCDLPSRYRLDRIRGFLDQNFSLRYQISETESKFTVTFNDWLVRDRFFWSLKQGEFDL